ncbi:unnamed protein product, partial [Polarella glacialis]
GPQMRSASEFSEAWHHHSDMVNQDKDSGICVHSCGRLEAFPVQKLTLSQVCTAARRAFDFPHDVELKLKGPDGLLLQDDAALEGLSSVHAELPETGFHDIERRVDQLQHMQISYICERLTTLREDLSGRVSSELLSLREALEQEQGSRHLSEEVMRLELCQQREELRLQLLRLQVAESEIREMGQVGTAVKQESAERASEKAVDQMEARLARDVEDFRQASWLDASGMEHRQAQVERGLQEVRDVARSAAASAALAKAGIAELAATAAAAAEAASLERRERLSAESTICTRMDELGAALMQEAQRASQLEHTTRGDRQTEVVMELGEQLGAALEIFNEERLRRSSEESPASSQAVEALRRACEELRRRTEDSEVSVGRMTRELARRIQEEVERRDSEVSDVNRRLAEEVDSRLEGEQEVSRLLSALDETLGQECEKLGHEALKGIQRCSSSLEEERKERVAEVQEMNQKLCKVQRLDGLDLEALLAMLKQEDVAVARKESLEAAEALRAGLAEERSQRADATRRLREDCREAIQREVGARMTESAKIREEVQSESRVRKEALLKLHRAIGECGLG